MSDKSGQAFPVSWDGPNAPGLGLTKREYFAGQAMQGMASDPSTITEVASYAVELAEALIAELEKGE